MTLCLLKTQVCPKMHVYLISFSRCTLPLHTLSQANLPLIIHISSIFQNQISSDPYNVQLGLWLPARAPPARLLLRRERRCWIILVVLHNRRISAVCLRKKKNRLNKLTKPIVEHFMKFPMMQSAVFQQRITQKSHDEWGPLHGCVMDFITLQKFPCLIFFSHDVQTMLTHSPLINTLNGHSHSCCCSWSCQCVFVFVLGDDTTLWGQMGWKQLGEQRKSGETLLTYKEFDEEVCCVLFYVQFLLHFGK